MLTYFMNGNLMPSDDVLHSPYLIQIHLLIIQTNEYVNNSRMYESSSVEVQ